jgi:hypothetical protein
MSWRGIRPFNLDHLFQFRWRGHNFSFGLAWPRQSTERFHGYRLEKAQAQATGHPKLNREHVHDLDDDRFLFCSLTVAKTGHMMRSTVRRLGRWLTMVKAFSDEALAPRSSPTASSWPPLVPRPVQWLQSTKISSNLVAARVRRLSSLVGENSYYGVHYL